LPVLRSLEAGLLVVAGEPDVGAKAREFIETIAHKCAEAAREVDGILSPVK
jgi:hypothetical protein